MNEKAEATPKLLKMRGQIGRTSQMKPLVPR